MINEKLMTSFEFIFQITSKLQIVPFAYDPKAKEWSVRRDRLRVLVSLLVEAILCFRLAFVTAALVTSDFGADNLHEDCLLALQVTMFINGAGFQIDFWRKRRELTWVFNQTEDMNKGECL